MAGIKKISVDKSSVKWTLGQRSGEIHLSLSLSVQVSGNKLEVFSFSSVRFGLIKQRIDRR